MQQRLLFPDDEPEPVKKTLQPRKTAKNIARIEDTTREQLLKLPTAVAPRQPDTPPPSGWYAPLRAIESRGSQTQVVGGLAGLHEARKIHEGQFFTPDAIVALMWRLVRMDADHKVSWQKVKILDNSFGSGRMFQYADPEKHELFGIEKDEDVVEAVRDVVSKAGFTSQLMSGSMEEFRLGRKLDVAFINPPFSVHLDSPLVEPFPCNSFGRHGAKSAAFTHDYAIAQALSWCRVVVAVAPPDFRREGQDGSILLGSSPGRLPPSQGLVPAGRGGGRRLGAGVGRWEGRLD